MPSHITHTTGPDGGTAAMEAIKQENSKNIGHGPDIAQKQRQTPGTQKETERKRQREREKTSATPRYGRWSTMHEKERQTDHDMVVQPRSDRGEPSRADQPTRRPRPSRRRARPTPQAGPPTRQSHGHTASALARARRHAAARRRRRRPRRPPRAPPCTSVY